jgi:hypothetical protein
MDQQYSKKRYSDRYRQLFRFLKLFTMLASSLAGLIWYQFGCHFIMTAFVSILIGLYFIFMTTEKA